MLTLFISILEAVEVPVLEMGGVRFFLSFAGFKSSKSLKKLQKSLLFIDDKLRGTTMIAGHLKNKALEIGFS